MPSTAEKILQILVKITETDRVRADPILSFFDSGLLASPGIVTLIARLSDGFGIDVSLAGFARGTRATPATLVQNLRRRAGS